MSYQPFGFSTSGRDVRIRKEIKQHFASPELNGWCAILIGDDRSEKYKRRLSIKYMRIL